MSKVTRKYFTAVELATYYHVHRNTMSKWMAKYSVDLTDLDSTLRFVCILTAITPYPSLPTPEIVHRGATSGDLLSIKNHQN